jgi:hypothetical protein
MLLSLLDALPAAADRLAPNPSHPVAALRASAAALRREARRVWLGAIMGQLLRRAMRRARA